MGRGRDKTIDGRDIQNMSPQERGAVLNLAATGRARITGTAVVRNTRSGNAKYSDPRKAGKYNEDKI